MATTLAGTIALVTGATSGIGREIALQLAERGAQVVVHGRSAERGAKMVQEIQNIGGKARFVAADLNNADDVRRLAAEAGPVDILVNNAGIYKFGGTLASIRGSVISSAPRADWDESRLAGDIPGHA